MQNIDFYERKSLRMPAPHAASFDPEYFPRLAQNTPREMERVRKKASRMFFVILSLCIISFTTGIVIGVKFSGGTRREIVDARTFNAVTDLGKQFSHIVGEKPAAEQPKESMFPRQSYPYVIRIDREYDQASAQQVAGFLSKRGHTIILTKNNGAYRMYIGPFKSIDDAGAAMKKISGYNKYSLAEKSRLIKR